MKIVLAVFSKIRIEVHMCTVCTYEMVFTLIKINDLRTEPICDDNGKIVFGFCMPQQI